jgi:S-DNA-T family DNA segregation ATPase FtsK/SpoIIIE
MSRRKKEPKDDDQSPSHKSLSEETLQGILAVVFFVVGIFLIIASPALSGSGCSSGKAGFLGEESCKIFSYLFGFGYYILPILFFILCVSFFRSLKKRLAMTHTVGGLLFFLSSLAIINILFTSDPGIPVGGLIGKLISYPIVKMFDVPAGIIILLACLIISILIMFDAPLKPGFLSFLWRREKLIGEKENLIVSEPKILNPSETIKPTETPDTKNKEPEKKFAKDVPRDSEFGIATLSFAGKEFVPPPLSLLLEDRGKPGVGDIKANSNIIKRTLQNFGINVEMDEISIGPSITRYALKPAEGVKLSRIVALQNDLSLALAAHPIRIEAPIPGKSLVGIEIPNSTKTTVGLGTLLASPEFQNSDKPLLMCLGKGISGMSYFGNLAKSPHLLIAGATGSGKSVTIHTVITSLLYRNSPDNLKFIMVDPKRVELTLYNGIPHLLTPVITEAKKTILALKWAAKEMDRRYDILQSEGLQNIESYHKNVLEPEIKKRRDKKSSGEDQKPFETMPYIVIIIDELADIMTAYPRELEAAVVRLAQMSRAVGIHLILSTQRPSVNVITGLIKANIPSRIALQVASQIDSRTILDMSGAEKLLGAGDMLYLSGEMSQPRRIQSAFISETETKNVVKYLKESYENEAPSEINITGGNGENSDVAGSFAGKSIFETAIDDEKAEADDDLYEDARQTVIEAGKASTSYLQRKLGVGYARAAKLIDMLEERGVVGPGSGAKPREVLIGGSSDNSSTSAEDSGPVATDNNFGETP